MTLVDTSSWIQYLRRDGEAEMKEKVRSLLLDGKRGRALIIDIWLSGGVKINLVGGMGDVTCLLRVTPSKAKKMTLLQDMRPELV